MQTHYFIPPRYFDIPVINGVNIFPAPSSGLKNSHDNVPVIGLPQAGNALLLPRAAEHNAPHADEKFDLRLGFLRQAIGEENISG